MRITPGYRHGFSLIEVTLAMGIAAFSLVAMLSLFSIGLDSSRKSASDTVIPRIVSQILSESSGASAPAVDETRTFYFTEGGERTGGNSPYVYACELRAVAPDPNALPDVSDHLVLLNLQITSSTEDLHLQATAVR